MTGARSLAATLLTATSVAAFAGGQTVQYRSPAGVEYRSQVDTGAIARAESALVSDPRNVERIIQLGIAQSGARQFREAISTFTRGLTIAPDNPLLLRWRGHRYLSVREFDRAMEDLTRGSHLDSTIYGIWYHLGIVRYSRGDFAGAAEAFTRAQPRAPDAGELAGATDWLWMSLMRAGRNAEAQAMLARRPDSLTATNAYARRLKLYRGEIGPDEVITAADTADVQLATLSYGLGNWYLLRSDTTRARSWFERSISSGGWPAFGFIVSEIELGRLTTTGAQPPIKPNELTAAEKAAGWRLLLDGRTLKGWHGLGFKDIPPGLWVVEDGAIKHVEHGKGPLQADGQPLTGMDLISDSPWRDFELSWEWKIAEAGNSGLKYNVSEELSTRMSPPHAAKGWEYQIIDDERNEDNKLPSHRSGALYDMFAPNEKKRTNPVGQWNRSKIIFRGNHGEHWLNGERILEFDQGTAAFDSAFAKSKYQSYPRWFPTRRKGHIVLQDHGDVVWFRDIKIRELR